MREIEVADAMSYLSVSYDTLYKKFGPVVAKEMVKNAIETLDRYFSVEEAQSSEN